VLWWVLVLVEVVEVHTRLFEPLQIDILSTGQKSH